VQFTSGVGSTCETPNGAAARATTLPLNLIALIIAHLDDIGDLARVTRTSRLLCYMALPALYRSMALHSYAEMRFVNGRPEGFGGGSPFMMALNGLVTKAHAALVQEFRVWGEWKEVGVEDFAQGRVPDNTMMLNVLLRAATDRMTRLQSFAWELDCKPLKTVYQGLAAHSTLTSLTLKFPSSRMPRPSVTVPPIPNLRVFKATDIDPLCYCDDISLLMLHSTKLEDVRLHFSPRMRQQAEPSVSFQTYFGRCTRANRRLTFKHFAMQNFFGANLEGMESVLDTQTCWRATFIDSWGGLASNARTAFVDLTWRNIPKDFETGFRTVRCNELAPQHVTMIRSATGMEHCYFINASPEGVVIPHTDPPDAETARLGEEYLDALTRSHGSTLKHLLLSSHWALSPTQISDLVRFCPHLEQLGLALAPGSKIPLRLLLPFLPRLKVLRILANSWLEREMLETTHEERVQRIGADLGSPSGGDALRWIAMGDTVYKVGKTYDIEREDGGKERRREVRVASRDQVQHIEIFYLDCLDINADPVLPFSP